MAKAFSISQWLYVNQSLLAKESVEQLDFCTSSGGDVKFALAASDDESIQAQYDIYRERLELISQSISMDHGGEVVLSISIRAYEYVPEIALPSGLVAALASIRASIDVDVINMLE